MKKINYVLSLILCAFVSACLSTCLSVAIVMHRCDRSARDHKMRFEEVDHFITLLEIENDIHVKQYGINYDSYTISVMFEENDDDSEGVGMAYFELERQGFMEYAWVLKED